jgi:hypothetical protein
MKTPPQTTAECCAQQAAEIETLRGLAAGAVLRLKTLRHMARTGVGLYMASQAVEADLEKTLALLATHEAGVPTPELLECLAEHEAEQKRPPCGGVRLGGANTLKNHENRNIQTSLFLGRLPHLR